MNFHQNINYHIPNKFNYKSFMIYMNHLFH
jgi:hypothetical protein